MAAGANLVTVANSQPAGATFCLAGGTYNVTATIPAQTGDKWVGAVGANNARLSVLTGSDVTQIVFTANGISNVTIRNVIIEKFNTPNTGGLAALKTANGWIMDNIEVRFNAFTGIYLESNSVVRNSFIHHNGKVGVGAFRAVNSIFENNEVSFNNTKLWNQADEGGGKWVATTNLIMRGNYFHDNFDTGIWLDSENVNALVENNRSINNTNHGIHYEISCSAVIRNNIVEDNGESGIFVNASQNADVYGNTVRNNGDGIRVWAQDRGTGTNCRWITANANIHDNLIVMNEGFTGLQRCCGQDTTIFTSGTVRFVNNDYNVPNVAGQWFQWADGLRTWTQWQGYGQDLTGSINSGGPTPTTTTTQPPTTTTTAASTALALGPSPSGIVDPIFLTQPPGETRLFVAGQDGRIWIVENGVRLATPFLDVTALNTYSGEQGLLGLAFHPSYVSNGLFYINYTDNSGDTRIVEYQRSTANLANTTPVRQLLFIDQPAANHNGGWLAFGPDGLLYIAMGDGGGSNDQFGNAQNNASLLGKILRMNVNVANPPAVIWVKGVRNPWRNTFDGNNLYIADVGQSQREEVTVVPITASSPNLGWPIVEGNRCVDGTTTCNKTGLTAPTYEYTHANGCSITGGYVFRGPTLTELTGRYFFSDYCTGTLRSFTYSGGVATDVRTYSNVGDMGSVISFGVDTSQNLYILTQEDLVRKLIRG